MTTTVEILIATYNGAAFIESQINSFLDQTLQDWSLTARDDGSVDGTRQLLVDFAASHPGRVRLLEDGRGNLGVAANFAALMAEAKAPYAALADQDDIWLPRKIESALSGMRSLERDFGPDTPLMVFSDRQIIDDKGGLVAPSWSVNEGAPLTIGQDFAKSLFMNVVAGCTTLVNAPLLRLAADIPKNAKSHDHWLTLVATQFGRVGVLDKANILYRAHGGNVAGVRSVPASDMLGRARRLFFGLETHRARYEALYRQAAAFLEIHGRRMSEPERSRLERVVAMRGRSAPFRLLEAARAGVLPDGIGRRLGFLLAGGGARQVASRGSHTLS